MTLAPIEENRIDGCPPLMDIITCQRWLSSWLRPTIKWQVCISLYFMAFPPTETLILQRLAVLLLAAGLTAPTLLEAEAVAREWISDAHWQIESLDESKIIEQSDYERDPTGIEYFQQALIDGEVLVFYCYPRDDRN